MGDSLTAPVWADAMSTRFHVMAATKGYQPSFLAIGDAFFYGRGGLPRYVYTLYRIHITATTIFVSCFFFCVSYQCGYITILHDLEVGVP